jgi:microcystin-dependent protein
MSEPFIAEIRIFAGNFAPRSWAFCNGQLLPIAQNTALFSLIGTIYGGDGRTTTALPNLQGRAPMHAGRGPGLTPRTIGQRSGFTDVTLTESQMPSHTHSLLARNNPALVREPSSAVTLSRSRGTSAYQQDTANNLTNMASEALPPAFTGPGAHTNVQPLLGLNFIIALQGLYPSRS